MSAVSGFAQTTDRGLSLSGTDPDVWAKLAEYDSSGELSTHSLSITFLHRKDFVPGELLSSNNGKDLRFYVSLDASSTSPVLNLVGSYPVRQSDIFTGKTPVWKNAQGGKIIGYLLSMIPGKSFATTVTSDDQNAVDLIIAIRKILMASIHSDPPGTDSPSTSKVELDFAVGGWGGEPWPKAYDRIELIIQHVNSSVPARYLGFDAPGNLYIVSDQSDLAREIRAYLRTEQPWNWKPYELIPDSNQLVLYGLWEGKDWAFSSGYPDKRIETFLAGLHTILDKAIRN